MTKVAEAHQVSLAGLETSLIETIPFDEIDVLPEISIPVALVAAELDAADEIEAALAHDEVNVDRVATRASGLLLLDFDGWITPRAVVTFEALD